MRRSSVRLEVFTAGQTRLLVVQPSDDRWGLIIFPQAGDMTVAPDSLVPTTTIGWFLDNTSTPFFLRRDIHGDVVGKGWNIRSVAAGSTLIIEVFADG